MLSVVECFEEWRQFDDNRPFAGRQQTIPGKGWTVLRLWYSPLERFLTKDHTHAPI
jgi:hypothetical protein